MTQRLRWLGLLVVGAGSTDTATASGAGGGNGALSGSGAAGGIAYVWGTNGGLGGAVAASGNGVDNAGLCNGGGGGGGAGRIRINAQVIQPTPLQASPPASTSTALQVW